MHASTKNSCVLKLIFSYCCGQLVDCNMGWVYNVLIFLIGDFQLNLGPRNKCNIKYFIRYWNLNSIGARQGLPLKGYIAAYKFSIVCILEIYIDSSIASDDGNLEISGHNLIRSDHFIFALIIKVFCL